MFVSIFITAMGLFSSFITILAIPYSEPHITTFTGLAGVAGILAGCIGLYFHDKE